ncbi:hypothetical protein BIW11_05941, partial [Tropilaelaps mercedesae]
SGKQRIASPRSSRDDFRVGYPKHAPCLAKPNQRRINASLTLKLRLKRWKRPNSTIKLPWPFVPMSATGSARRMPSRKHAARRPSNGQLIIKMASASSADVMCQGFDLNLVCQSLLPSPGTHPKGTGKSLVSKVLKAYMKSWIRTCSALCRPDGIRFRFVSTFFA